MRPDGLTIDYGFDSAGRLSTITTPTGVSTYAYSATTGMLTSIAAPGGVTVSYTWDGSLLKDTSWTGPVAGVVSRSYNSDFDVSSLTVGGTSVSLSRDNDRLITGVGALTVTRDPTTGFVGGTTLGSVTTSRGYDAFGAVASTSATAGATALYSTSVTMRDALGRIRQLDETIEGVSSSTVFDYTEAGRLWKVTVDGNLVAEYGYDLNGNRTSVKNDLGMELVAVYDAQDRLQSFNGASYIYGPNGELQTKTDSGGVTSFSYDVLGNLRSAVLADGRTVEYLIDGRNRRIGKKVNGALVQGFLYTRGRVVAELDAGGAVVSRFVYATRRHVPDYIVKGGATYRIVSDHLGSPRLVVDAATGAVVQRMDFDEWGRVLHDTNPGFQPFGFAGGLYDRDTALVRFGARDYDAETGRWTAKDPLVFSARVLNAFAYAGNDPVNRIDPSGLASIVCTISNGFDEDGDDLDFGYFGVGGGGDDGTWGLAAGGLGDGGGDGSDGGGPAMDRCPPGIDDDPNCRRPPPPAPGRPQQSYCWLYVCKDGVVTQSFYDCFIHHGGAPKAQKCDAAYPGKNCDPCTP